MITSLILVIAFIIYNRAIIYTFDVPDFKILAFVTFNVKNGADVANKYNLFDKLLRSHAETKQNTEMKNK